MTRTLTRREKIFHALNPKGFGLEIGPSHKPIAPKREGFNVHTLDHLPTEQLRKKYAGHDIDVSNIEEVDFVWTGGPLEETIGATGRYDWIIASHVIEHVPDLVAFLRSCETLLAPDGVLSLVIPDKRYCFDFFRWPSSTGDALQAHVERRERHPPGIVFDQVANATRRAGQVAWDASTRDPPQLMNTLDAASERFRAAVATDIYRDVHGWRFTPASFRLILHDLCCMELVGLREVAGFDPAGCEFYISLGKTPERDREPPDRLALAMAMMGDIKDWLADIDTTSVSKGR